MAAKPSIKILKESAKLWNAEIAGGSIKAAVDGLSDFFKGKYGAENLAECPICKNDGPEKMEDGTLVTHCPFCGTKFQGQADEQPKPSTKSTKAGKPSTKVRKKKGAEKEEKEEYIATPEQKAELATHVERLTTLRQNIAQNSWEVGTELVAINDGGLWRGLGYDSFFAYCQGDLDFSRASAYKYMLCSREFSQEDFLGLGVKKGELVAGAPEQHRRKLMNSAKKGASFTELKARLNKLEGKTSGGGSTPSKSITLLGRVREGDIEVPWLSARTHNQITKADVKGRYLRVPLTDEIELIIVPTENELSVTANFRKVTDEAAPAETKPDEAEKPAETAAA
jgi:uncharacterized Zn finger protein (UPF0148 family)